MFQLSRRFFSSFRHSGVYNGVSELIGNTPIIKMNSRLPGLDGSIDLYGKIEYFNPSSSVKDRLAYGVILAAEQSGALKPGDTIIEATSGNTGIALAMLAAERGYRCVITMSETFSIERRKLMRAYGAKVIITPGKERGTGMVNKAKELANKYGWFYPRQFETTANAAYHAKTTGPEIIHAFRESPLDYFITGYGTGGTINGVGKILRAASPNTKIIIAESEGAALVSNNNWNKQNRNTDGSPTEGHPSFNPHPIEGWTPNFCPLIVEEAFKLKLIDDTITVTNQEAINTALDLARTQGLFVGISAGGSMAAALKYSKKIIEKYGTPKNRPLRVLTMLPDTGERYHSTSLMTSISADMNEEEKQISLSTPGYQLPPPQPKN